MGAKQHVDFDRMKSRLGAENVINDSPVFDRDNPKSRAVALTIEPGYSEYCALPECGDRASYAARNYRWMVAANVYNKDGKWEGLEIFFPPECYLEAGLPHGPVYRLPLSGAVGGPVEVVAVRAETEEAIAS